MNHPVPAKISRPHPLRVLARPRLFRQLDQGCKRTLVWVNGPPGAGKTTLVSSYLDARKRRCLWYQVDTGDADVATFFYYLRLAAGNAAPRYRKPLPHLTPEYLAGLPVFARRYFEALGSRLKSPCVLVLDNYQEVGAEAALHGVLCEGLLALPAGFTAIVISRTDPPPELARLRANENLALIGWEDLQLTLPEATKLGRLSKRNGQPAVPFKQLYDKTHGWAAGLVLLLEQGKAGALAARSLHDSSPQILFDYFATEIFAKMEAEAQHVLLMSAFLPKMTAGMVERLTGIATAGRLPAQLNRRNYFTLMHAGTEPVYEYHPLFREFLLARAQASYTAEWLRDVRKRAAALLEADGQIEHAAMLWRDAEDATALAALIDRQAEPLLTQGRGRVLESWLRALPPSFLEQAPSLLFHLGVCRLAFDPVEARGYFEKAYSLFERTDDVAGMLVVWSGIIDTFVYEWGDFSAVDHWIAVLDALLARISRFPSRAIEARVVSGMFTALMYRQPQRPDLPQWALRVRSIVLDAPDVHTRMVLGNQLLHYYTSWLGDLAEARLLLEAVRRPANAAEIEPLTYIVWCAMEAGVHWYMTAHDECLRAVNGGLEKSDETGVRFMNSLLLSQGIIGSLTAGDMATAERLLQRAAATMSGGRQLDRAHYHFFVFLDAFYRKNTWPALVSAREAVALGDAAGVPFCQALYRLCLAHALYDRGETRAALVCLAQARRIGRCITNIEFGCLFSAVSFALDRGKRRLVIPILRKMLAIARQRGYINRPLWTPEIMTRLFATALELGIEVEFVQELIRKRKLAATPEVAHLERWPFPVRLHTFGRFSVSIDDKPLTFVGKAQKKPLELLKGLIAFGGREVNEDKLAKALWPLAEDAPQALATTVHRLRKLIGDEAIERQEGFLSLNPRRCWVDVWAFERQLTLLEEACQASDVPTIARLAERVLALYGGGFLAADTEAPWALLPRERLRTRLLRQLDAAATSLARVHRHDAAILCYRKALEIDPLAETLYLGLMQSYVAAGRSAEALSVYERCRNILHDQLGVFPSARAEAFARQLKAG